MALLMQNLCLGVFQPFRLVPHSAELSGLNKMPILNSNRRMICLFQGKNFKHFFEGKGSGILYIL